MVLPISSMVHIKASFLEGWHLDLAVKDGREGREENSSQREQHQ